MADWYVHNVREFPWFVNEKFGARGVARSVRRRCQVGVRVHVLEPGKPSTMYHRETGQEGFLVVEGELLLIVEGEERTLKQWDYFHCPPGVTHSFVGAGDGPCVMVTLGLRGGSIVYERNDARAFARRGRRGGDGHAERRVRPVPGVGRGPSRFVGRASLEPRLLAMLV